MCPPRGGRAGLHRDGRAGRQPVPRNCEAAKLIFGTGLVSFDPASRTLTVKTRLLRQAATEVERLNVGDRVLLAAVRSGHPRRRRSPGRQVDPAQRIVEFFALPAELRPAMSLAIRLRSKGACSRGGGRWGQGLKPTDWVTLMARQRPRATPKPSRPSAGA